MKVTVSRSLLADALRKVQGLASGRNSMPILSNVKIEARGQKMEFTTTDIDMSIVASITCHVISEGATTLPAKLLSDAISKSSEGDVSIEVDDTTDKATIKAGSSIFRMAGLPEAEFPRLPESDSNSNRFVIPQDVLKNVMRRTSYAMSDDETRRSLRGLHFVFGDGKLTCVATDGRRLSIAEYAPDDPYQFNLEFTIPAKSVLEITKNLGNTGNITIAQNKSQITVSLDNGVVIYSKLIDDLFPNYKQVIPASNDNVVVIDRAALVAAIDRVGIFSEAHSMKFDFVANELNLLSSTEAGKGEESVPVKYEGEEIHTTFNHSYILDVLKSMDDDEVKFAFSNGTKPVVITDSSAGLALVMPLRVS